VISDWLTLGMDGLAYQTAEWTWVVALPVLVLIGAGGTKWISRVLDMA